MYGSDTMRYDFRQLRRSDCRIKNNTYRITGSSWICQKQKFIEGETVYDVLKRVCAYSGIDLSYDWTVKYGGYYIEGINHLFEFDCGSGSGWMYKVNGWYPNYGCSNYILKDKDIIVWNYTCNLGKDVGCDWLEN